MFIVAPGVDLKDEGMKAQIALGACLFLRRRDSSAPLSGTFARAKAWSLIVLREMPVKFTRHARTRRDHAIMAAVYVSMMSP
jgi:uncharacterized protein GlcG (DUF336 family)